MKFMMRVLIFFLFGSYAYSQEVPKLYIGINGLNNMQRAYMQNNNLKAATIFYQVDVAPGEGKYLNSDLFTKRIEDKIPNKNATGLAIIDWEIYSMKVFTDYDDLVEHSRMINEFIETITIAKKLRPNVKWGFFDLPLRTFDGNNQKWSKANEMLMPLLKYVDVLAPSVYIYNPDPNVYNLSSPRIERGKGDYVVKNIEESLRIGKLLNKDVYPFIWHRMNSGDKNVALKLVPLSTFRNYVKIILSRNFEGKKVNGLIWWDSQEYFYQVRKKFGGLSKEYENVQNVDQYNLGLFQQYYGSIKRDFRN